MQTVDEAAPAQTEHFVSQVSAAIPRLQERTTLLRERLEDSTLDDPTGSCDDATAHLQRLGQEASALKAQAEQYRQYQMQLRQPVTEFTDLEDACMEVDIRSKVWVGIRTWTHLTETWKSAAMDEIDPQELNRQVKAYSTTVVKAMRVIPESRIVLALKVAVDDFKRLLPVRVARWWAPPRPAAVSHLGGHCSGTVTDHHGPPQPRPAPAALARDLHAAGLRAGRALHVLAGRADSYECHAAPRGRC